MPAALRCPRCQNQMRRIGDGVYSCGAHRWLDDTPEEEEPDEDWGRPTGLSLSYVPGTVHGGGGDRASCKSPAKQKMESWLRRQRGIHIQRIRIEPVVRRTEK